MRTVSVIQARMGSTRVPGKVMKDLKGSTVLSHIISRVKQANLIDDIVIATTTRSQDDIVADEAKKYGAKVFRGPEDDLLARYYFAAKENDAQAIVRITSDCPLIDPHIVDDIVGFYHANDYDAVTNGGHDPSRRTFPRGLDTAVFSFAALEKAFAEAKEQFEREHVTPYIYKHFRVFYYRCSKDLSQYRLTLDTEEDYQLIKEIYERLYRGQHDFYLPEIIDLLEKNPDLVAINRDVRQKSILE